MLCPQPQCLPARRGQTVLAAFRGGDQRELPDRPVDKQVDRGLDKVDGRVDDLVERIRQALPTERITTLVTNLERELPS